MMFVSTNFKIVMNIRTKFKAVYFIKALSLVFIVGKLLYKY